MLLSHGISVLKSINSESAIIVNLDIIGMYHVAYDERNWKNIGSVLMKNVDTIPESKRLQLLKQLIWSMRRKDIKLGTALCIGEYLKVNFMVRVV